MEYIPESVWVLVNYSDHDQPVYGVYARHEVAVAEMDHEFPALRYPNLRLEEWAVRK